MATEIIVPRRREDFFNPNGDPTLRFVRWMEAVTEGGNDTSSISDKTIALASRMEGLLNLKGLTNVNKNDIAQIRQLMARFESTLLLKPKVADNEREINNIKQLMVGD